MNDDFYALPTDAGVCHVYNGDAMLATYKVSKNISPSFVGTKILAPIIGHKLLSINASLSIINILCIPKGTAPMYPCNLSLV